jgi:hypothetical protein
VCTRSRSRRRRPIASFQVCLGFVLTCTLWLDGSEHVRKPDPWPRVFIKDAFTRAAVEWALTGAAAWLANEECRGVLTEFRDEQGHPLAERLDAHRIDARGYLALILFRDGSGAKACADDLTFAVTTPLGRVVYVCGRNFERAWRASARRGQAIVIHEMLHTLGLGENPPPSDAITQRILARCDKFGAR